jgi:hypothetical protein
MRLKSSCSREFVIIESGDSINWNKICLLFEDKDKKHHKFIYGMGQTFNKGITLKELNDEAGEDFKVVND